MKTIKHIKQETILELTNEIVCLPGQVSSKTIAQNEAVSVTLFAFAKQEEISSHASNGDALVMLLEGALQIIIDGVEYELHAPQSIVMPALKPHSLHAREDTKMLLTVIFSSITCQKQ